MKKEYKQWGLNPRPSACKADVITTTLCLSSHSSIASKHLDTSIYGSMWTHRGNSALQHIQRILWKWLLLLDYQAGFGGHHGAPQRIPFFTQELFLITPFVWNHIITWSAGQLKAVLIYRLRVQRTLTCFLDCITLINAVSVIKRFRPMQITHWFCWLIGRVWILRYLH